MINVSGFSVCKIAGNYYWLGIFSDLILFPSIVGMGAGVIGINIASLINKQGLNLHKKYLESV